MSFFDPHRRESAVDLWGGLERNCQELEVNGIALDKQAVRRDIALDHWHAFKLESEVIGLYALIDPQLDRRCFNAEFRGQVMPYLRSLLAEALRHHATSKLPPDAGGDPVPRGLRNIGARRRLRQGGLGLALETGLRFPDLAGAGKRRRGCSHCDP